MIEKLKLEHLDLLSGDKIDYANLMIELNGYKNTWFNKKFIFLKSFKKTYSFIESIKNVDPTKVLPNPDCGIKRPNDIDEITFSAMMSLRMLFGSDKDMKVSELMNQVISITCFSANNEEEFDVDSIAFKQFKDRLDRSNAFDMMGIYNWIKLELEKSDKAWRKRFFEVEVDDKDYQQAGGERMGVFNIVNTIRNSCTDFNVTYQEAWQLPYALIQTNSLSKATSAHIQHLMSKIKETRMKSKRR